MNGYARHEVMRDGVPLALHVESGEGPFVVLQHGLCGDAGQPAEVFPHGNGARHMVLECRGHGDSAPGPSETISITTFTDDLAAALDGFAGGPSIVGGISMGAAIALRLACTRPDLVSGLVLARPAWVCDAAPENMRPNLEVGRILAAPPAPGEADRFLASETGQKLAREAPDNLASLLGFFQRAPREVTSALLTRISEDGPGVTEAEAARLTVPTLVIGTADDLIHPLAHARQLADLIASARFAEIPSKARDKAAYVAAFRAALGSFIKDTLHA